MNRTGTLAAALTLLVCTLLIGLLLILLRTAQVLNYDDGNTLTVAVATTAIDAALLSCIVGFLIYEWLLARREQVSGGKPIPAILTGLIALYILALWIFLGPTVYWVGTYTGIAVLTQGFNEPESRLTRNAVVLAFALLSAWLLVVRYRARHVAEWISDLIERRFKSRRKDTDEA